MTRIQAVRSGLDTFEELAIDALFTRVMGSVAAAAQEHFPNAKLPELPTASSNPMGNHPLSYFMEHSLIAAGIPYQKHNREEIALKCLQQGGYGIRNFSGVQASGPQFNRPGDFPNLLSNLAGKVMDLALQLADPTYPIYSHRIPDKDDFRPINVLRGGQFDALDLIIDGKPASELAMAEEAGGWLQIDRYANKVGLTPIMLANDDLDSWSQQIASLAYAHEQTLNRLCLSLVTTNVVLLDGTALFDNSRGNIVASGGAPSSTQAGYHRNLHLLQTGVNGQGKVRTPPAIALVPVELADEAEQTYLSPGVLLEAALKRPSSDTNINVHRGKVRPVVEPELSDASAEAWYTFANPAIRPVIAHVFMTGYGPGGRRSTWFDQDTETRYTKLEGRFAAAAVSGRGAVRNPGS